MLLQKRFFGIFLALSFLLAGCETTNPQESFTAPSVSSLKGNKAMQPQIAQAFSLLKEQKFSEASSYINQTLQAQPKSVALHTLNGLTYEKLAEQGDAKGLELAIVGYQNAINLDPFNSFAIVQLGKIKYRDQQYDQAQEYFANALLLKPNDPDLMHELAAASYYAYDIKTAVATIKRAEKLKPEDPLIQRSAAMIYAAVGDFKTAEKHFKLFQAKVGEDPEVTHVTNRFNDWKSLYKSGRLHLAADVSNTPSSDAPSPSGPDVSSPNATSAAGSGATGIAGANASSTVGPAASSTDGADGSSKDAGSADGGLTVDTAPPSQEDVPTKEQFKEGDIGKNVVDAPITPGISGGQSSRAAASPHLVEETNPQVIMDCYILQITENARTRKGHNILDNLAVTLNPGSYAVFKGSMWGSGASPINPESGGTSANNFSFKADSVFNNTVLNTNGGGPAVQPSLADATTNLLNGGSVTGRIFTAGITWAGLTYSLNIANATDDRTEIVSRPTLMTFLKKESRFFSGIELVNVGSGQYGSNLNRYPVGVTVAVTPHSITNDVIILNIGVEASILQSPNPNLAATVDVGKTRVETTVKMRLGETVMLGGIYERDEVDAQTGFPGLRDVPIIQYFFSQQATLSSRRSIAILLTPRSPDAVRSAVNRAMTRESVRPHFTELVSRNPDWFNPDANAINIFSYINQDPILYYEFRTGDILPPSWGYDVTLKDKLAELSSFLYY